jgi:cardiolipin synthase A/B
VTDETRVPFLFALAAYAFGACVAVHAIFYKKRYPAAAVAWVVVCLSVPLLGGLLYLLIGHDRITRVRRRRIRKAHEAHFAETRARRATKSRTPPPPKTRDDLPSLRRLSEGAICEGVAADVLVGGAAAYDRMTAAIASAKRRVRLQTFIFDADEAGERFANALAERAAAGVDVRVLVDAVGTSSGGARVLRRVEKAGGRVATFLPFHPLKRRFQVNLRNHRKMLVVDDDVSFTGSMNVSARHLRFDKRGSHDVVVAFRGAITGELADVFASDWRFATGESIGDEEDDAPTARFGDETVQLVESGPDHVDRGAYHVILAAIYAAKRDVVLVTPYFVPPPELLTALQTAAARGVRVRLAIPGRNNHFVIHYATRGFLAPLLKTGVEVSEKPTPLLHMKLLVVDDVAAIVGSSNLDYRSFFLNFEADVVVYAGALQKELRKLAEAEWAGSTPMPEEAFERLPWIERFGVRAAALFAPVL